MVRERCSCGEHEEGEQGGGGKEREKNPSELPPTSSFLTTHTYMYILYIYIISTHC